MAAVSGRKKREELREQRHRQADQGQGKGEEQRAAAEGPERSATEKQ